MRLLLLTDAVGGVWVYSLELARALRLLGIESVLGVMGRSPSDGQREHAGDLRLLDTGLPLEWLDTNPAGIRRAGEAIAAIANREGVDLVQTSSAALDLPTPRGWREGVARLADWLASERGLSLQPELAGAEG